MSIGFATRQLLRHAVRLYPRRDYLSESAVRHLRRKWLAAVRWLGAKHILAQRVQRRKG